MQWKTNVGGYNDEVRFYVSVHFSNLTVLIRDEVEGHIKRSFPRE